MKNHIAEAVILTLGLLFLGLLLKSGIDNFAYKDRCVSVKGLSEMEVPADKVICPLVFKEIGDDLQEIYTSVNARNKTIVTFLKNKGIDRKSVV